MRAEIGVNAPQFAVELMSERLHLSACDLFFDVKIGLGLGLGK